MRGDLQNFAVYWCGYRRRHDVGFYWKSIILHQLRNLLMPVCAFVLGAWSVLSVLLGQPSLAGAFWSAILLPPTLAFASGAMKEANPSRLGASFASCAIDIAYKAACIPLMAFVAIDAAASVLRSIATGRGLLRWRASSQDVQDALAPVRVGMHVCAIAAVGALLLLAREGRLGVGVAIMLVLWAVAPLCVRSMRKRPQYRNVR
jgi:hypothetical protein